MANDKGYWGIYDARPPKKGIKKAFVTKGFSLPFEKKKY